MTVDVKIGPELKGELDASKLARLLDLLPEVSATFSQANCLASVMAADVSVFGVNVVAQSMTTAILEPSPLLFPDIVGALMKTQSKNGQPSEAEREEEERKVIESADLKRVNMCVTINIPEVALDLTYDINRGRNLVLAVHTLKMDMFFRRADMQVSGEHSSSSYCSLLIT